jgi:hypothetical protein
VLLRLARELDKTLLDGDVELRHLAVVEGLLLVGGPSSAA